MTDAHSARQHAKLSPSSAHRFIACPGSVALEAGFPDSSGDAANEGTAAHELAAWTLGDPARSPGDMAGRVIDITADNDVERFLMGAAPHKGDTNRWPVTDEMVEAVALYVDHVRLLGGELSVEERLSMEHVHPDIWGTGDAACYHPEEKHLFVCDLKYGRGVVVEAENNSQLVLYASGAAARLHNRGVDRVTVTIVQPRAQHPKGPIRSVAFDMGALKGAEEKIAAAAKRATEAASKYYGDPLTPALRQQMEAWRQEYLSPGDHCRFCKAGAVCPARADRAMADAQAEFSADGEVQLADPETMSADALGDLLTKARRIQHWIKAVEEHAHAEAMAGRIPDGFKLVAKRSTRKWSDEDGLIAAAPMMFSVGPDELYERKLVTPAALEKKLPKDERAALAAFVTKSSSGTNLVPVGDARQSAKPSAEEEFS